MDMIGRYFPDAAGRPIIWPRVRAVSMRFLTLGTHNRPKLRDRRAALGRESRPSTVGGLARSFSSADRSSAHGFPLGPGRPTLCSCQATATGGAGKRSTRRRIAALTRLEPLPDPLHRTGRVQRSDKHPFCGQRRGPIGSCGGKPGQPWVSGQPVSMMSGEPAVVRCRRR
jgi:hypothetical protein